MLVPGIAPNGKPRPWLDKSRPGESQNTIFGKDSFVLGLFQTFALIPGASRSALVIMGAFYLGFRSIDALKISFLLAIPTLVIIFFGENYLIDFEYKIKISELLLVIFFSFVTAFITIHYFLKLVNKIGLLPFVIYRFLLAGILIFI